MDRMPNGIFPDLIITEFACNDPVDPAAIDSLYSFCSYSKYVHTQQSSIKIGPVSPSFVISLDGQHLQGIWNININPCRKVGILLHKHIT
jgi:hypothetical protein